MSQFASTLYPQTNPSNAILLYARERRAEGESYGTILWRTRNGGVAATLRQFSHAEKVLTALVNLEGSSTYPNHLNLSG